ncbi:PhlD [Streptomyces spectabilis]|uniref:PhlD n=1 Tax=Streptomyces spectabilis TaxID=68270 RepID=A0A516RJW5_STRST|nr:PhlD [Streptomyces spectabilis]QDQ15958.1 PhlD [Streptomyces spectabilis]
MAYVTRPSIVLPEHEIPTSAIVRDIIDSLPPDPQLPSPAVINRWAVNLKVDTRRFVAPLEVVSRTGTVTGRNNHALPVMYRMATTAACDALDAVGLDRTDVDCVITSHSTTPATPGLDVHLVNELDLRPDVMRMPATQLGCVGGAHALAWAARLVDAMPGLRVLVVIGEALSTVYRRDKNDPAGILYRMLFGDGAGACVVSSDPRNACLEVRGSWQQVVPNTVDSYTLEVEPAGLHFTSEKWAPDGVNHLMGPLWEWLHKTDPYWVPEVVIAHPGGPRILEDATKGLGCAPELLTHSWESLRTRGNLGGVAVLDVLARTAVSAPPHGSRTLVLGIGPGLTGAAVEGRWHNPTTSQEGAE